MLTIETKFQDSPENMPDPNERRNKAISEALDMAKQLSCRVRVGVGVSFYLVEPMDTLESVLGRYRATPRSREWVGEPGSIGYRGESGPIKGERL